MDTSTPMVSADEIGSRIFLIRGRRVMLDSDLARMYDVPTKRLNEQVRRNARRFPEDFAFQLSVGEYKCLMSQIATSKKGRGGRRKLPFVFTQEGVAMLSGVLQSLRAIDVNIAIMRAFVRLRQMVSLNARLGAKLAELERKIELHDESIRSLFQAIRELMVPQAQPDSCKTVIGFKPDP